MTRLTEPELALWLRAGFDFTLLDVRRAAKRRGDGDQITGSRWLDPAAWLDWKDDVPPGRPAVVYCAHGREISQGLAAALCALGVDARVLEGGIDAWRRAGNAVEPIPPADAPG